MVVLGLHKDPWHSTGAAVVWDDGPGSEPGMVYVAEERLDRMKDSRAFPARAVAACLREAGVDDVRGVDLVVLDYIRDGRDWRCDTAGRPCRTDVFLADMPRDRVHVVNHHLLHAAAAYFSSPFEHAAILIVDGRGSDDETQTVFVAGDGHIERLESTTAIGVGLLYAAVTQAIGFANLQEGKTMGLAPYGADVGDRIFEFGGEYDGIRTDYGKFCVYRSYGIQTAYPELDTFAKRARAAYEVQEECERALLHLAEHVRALTGLPHLCLSGGVMLNSVANNAVRQAGIFEELFINPAASDTGIALGAALYGYHIIGGQPRTYEEISPFIGPRYGDEENRAAIARYSGFEVSEGDVVERAAALLAQNRIVGWLDGRSEMGPRALGNRSILMSPLRAENKDILNARVKHRETFRPFAPAVLEERSAEYFDLDVPSPYMLLVTRVHPEKRDRVPAITHVDGTARVQTLTPTRNGRFYDLTAAFGRHTGVPVLLNTSFNVAGEPIVETPEDAIRCFLGTEIDALVLGDCLLVKPGAR